MFCVYNAGFKYVSSEKSKHTKEYIYLFHAFSSTHLQYNEKSFDAYDTIFCVGPHHVKEIQKREQVYNLPQKNYCQ